MDLLYTILLFLATLALLVAIHEYGHFWVARRLGFKVERFSIGFGRPLLQWQGNGVGLPVSWAGNTRSNLLARLADDGGDPVEFRISAIPLGGYVKMLDEREGPVEPHEADRAFNRRPPWARIAVLFAGPGFNFIFAVIAYWLMFVTGVPGMRPFVDTVEPGSVVAEAGLEDGDIITAVGGRETATWESAIVGILDGVLDDGQIELSAQSAQGAVKTVQLDVSGRVSELTEPDALFDELGIRMGPRLAPVIGGVSEGLPAAAAGLQADDRVVLIDGEPVNYWDDLVALVRARPGRTVAVEVDRAGARVETEVEIGSVEAEGRQIGQIGVVNAPLSAELVERIRVVERYGVLDALGAGAKKTWETSVLTVRMIGRMLTGDVSIKSASGPIMIAAYAGDYAEAGPLAFLSFLSLISISLGIMNLLPVPILDGGRIVEQVIEMIKGSPLSDKSLIVGQQIGIAMLVVLTCIVFYNDIARLMAP